MTNTQSQLKRAIEEKNTSLVKSLLQHISVKESLKMWNIDILDSNGHNIANVVHGSERTRDQCTMLHIAASKGYTSIVRAILDSKPHLLNTKTGRGGFTALQLALLMDKERTAEYLIQQRAKTNGALAYAAVLGSSSIITMLLDARANVNEKVRDGATPLFFARTPGVVKTLVQNGANINHRDVYGWTPLMASLGNVYLNSIETHRPSPEMTETFIRHGADVSIKGRDRTPQSFEKNITALHTVFYNLYFVDDAIQMYSIVYNACRRKGLTTEPKTSNGNTPLLYFMKRYENSLKSHASFTRNRYGMNSSTKESNSTVKDILEFLLEKGSSLHDTNRYGKSGFSYIKSMTNVVNFSQRFLNRIGMSVIHNIHIPNNLNRTDPILLNGININNAYILKTDLVNKTINRNGKNTRVKEVKTVYNKSSLNGMIRSGRSLVSPVTRRPFSGYDVVRLKDVAPANEMNRYKRNRR
jgi:ankyrin repeat protein